MFEVSEIIYNILYNNTALQALVGTKIFPLLADQNVRSSFVIYYLQEVGSYSKNGNLEYTIGIEAYDDDYNAAVQLADTVKQAMEDASQVVTYAGATVELVNEKLVVVKQNYKLKN